ncbi:MAG TPA: 4-phosphoerythronate dehydrogenase PdxB [Victivallales bacterium]|nr:4-phosphoerythronate dehydrogenase PdxB [Victivallales bacterium]HPO89517.1 4-phosphoerythronate dehydrogenase PdxB [Victivallales bacterium]HRU00878.1 4-phosphoerythronate dehydrogenase PdxB [Victivallales bacterium]
MKFVVDSKIPFIKGVLEKKGIEVLYLEPAKIAKESVKDADGLIIRTRTKCNETLLEGTNVKFIATATIGFDHIDTNYCRKKDIFWTNAPGCNSSSVAQYICSAILNWALSVEKELKGLNIGIIGVGNVGSKVAKVSEILGMQTLLNDPPREEKEGKKNFVPLKTILEEADIITIHVPLEYEGVHKTFHFANDNFFSEIRKKPLFINSSRGEVVDSIALKKAISQNLISSAIIDVWENEPNIDRELLKLAKFATPHIAGYSTDGKANGTAMSIRAASRFFKLGLDDWYPDNIPLPENYRLNLSSSGFQFIADAVNSSYDIRKDDSALRESPESFENLRGKYPLRREFNAFEIDALGQSPKIINQLTELGFKINI